MKGPLDAWRARRFGIYHVRHDSIEPDSPYRPGQAGHDFKFEVAPAAGEPIIPKRTQRVHRDGFGNHACFTFARLDWAGRLCTAEQVHALSLANMHGEYCTVLTTRQALARLPLS